MPRAKLDILSNLDPHDPASIQALIDFHRTAFGGLVMEDDEDTGDNDGQDGGDDSQLADKGKDDKGKKKDDAPLGPNGEKALKAERDARKALETQLNQLTNGLKQALGITDQDAKTGGTDAVVATLQAKMATLEHNNRVLEVANTHRITDEGDLTLLRSITDDTAMQALAARLAPTSGDGSDGQDGTKPPRKRTPAADPGQGRGNREGGKATSVAQVMADRRAARDAKNTNSKSR